MTLPSQLYRSQQVKCGEVKVARAVGIDMYQLMLAAGKAVYDCVLQHYGNQAKLWVLCGGGNNGGDGYVVAKLALQQGGDVRVTAMSEPAKLSGDAKRAYEDFIAVGGKTIPFDMAQVSDCDVVVDALLGTGLSGDVRPEIATVITAINRSHIPVVAVDVPSGLCSNSGGVLGNSIKAAHTITFIGIKQGLVTGKARSYVGQLHYSPLVISAKNIATYSELSSQSATVNIGELFQNIETPSAMLDFPVILQRLKTREPSAHKGTHGKALLIGGGTGLGGAILLATKACLRAGAGLTACLTESQHLNAGLISSPEAIFAEWTMQQVKYRLSWCDVIAFGPGLGCFQGGAAQQQELQPDASTWAVKLAAMVAQSDKAKVLDADALTLLALNPNIDENRIITPHPGEAARLLNTSVAEIESDRYRAVYNLQAIYGGVVVLKGAGTLICDGNKTYVCSTGNPGMACGGMGDALTGIIVALLAQRLGIMTAARVGVMLHSYAADLNAEANGPCGLLASDVINDLRYAIQCA